MLFINIQVMKLQIINFCIYFCYYSFRGGGSFHEAWKLRNTEADMESYTS